MDEGKERTSAHKHSVARMVAGLVALLLLGVMASGALADGDPFSAITAITGTSTSSNDSSGTSSTSSDTTGASTDVTTTGETTTDAATTTEASTTDQSTTTTAVASNPTIATDAPDYAPGSTVTLIGSGWGGGESIHLVVNDTLGQTWQYTGDVVADPSGGFVKSFQLPNTFVSDYDVTATGAAGERATTTFTDGNVTLHLPAAEGVANMTVTYDRWNGNATCGVTPAAAPTSSNQTVAVSTSGGTVNIPSFGGSGDSVKLKSVSTTTGGKAFSTWTSGDNKSDAGTALGAAPCISNSNGTNGNVTDAYAHFANAIAATSLNVAGQTGTFGGTVSLSATLTQTSGGAAVSGKTIAFTLNGNSAGSATTNAGGVATLSNVSLSGISAGVYTAGVNSGISASFAGDASFSSSTGSATLTVNRASQSITFGALADKTFGDASFTVSATGGGSGNPVTFTTTGDCSSGGTNGSTITITGAGSCTVKADQAGNTNYDAAAQVSQSFDIAREAQSITFVAPPTAVYGSTFTVTPTADSGLAVGLATTTATACSVFPNPDGGFDVTMLTGTGICTLTASQAGDSNYEAATDVSRDVTAVKKAQTITFAAPTSPATYNTTFHVDPSSDSGLDVALSGTAGVCSVSPVDGGGFDVTMLTGTGTCALTASQAGDDNYSAATDARRDVDAAKANQSITFVAPPSAVYGSTFNVAPTSDSGLTVSIGSSGGCTSTAALGVGLDVTMTSGSTDCVLTASQAGNLDYNAATDVVKTVTAVKKAQTITFTALANAATYSTTFHVGPSSDSGLDVSLSGTTAVCSVTPVSQVDGGGFDVTMLTGTGTCTLTASQPGDDNYSAATDVGRDVAAAKAAATVNLTWVSPQTYDGGPHPASATVTGPVAADNPIGSPAVSFEYFVGGSVGAESTGSATAPTDAGTYAVRASFAGNTNYKPDSATTSITIDKRATSTSVVGDSASSHWGSPVTFTATVSGTGAGGGDPTSGNVTFIEGGTCASPTATIGGPVALDADSTASITTTTLSVADHTVVACYGGNANFKTSNESVGHSVTNTAPTVTLGTNPLTANEGDTKTYAFAIADPDPADSWTFAAGYPTCGTGNDVVALSPTIDQSAKTGSFQCRFADGVVPAAANVVKVEVTDFHAEASSEDTQSVVVSNVAPTVSSFTVANVLSGPMINGLTGTFTYSFGDPGTVDNPWVASFSWNGFADPVTQSLTTQNGSFNARPQFPAAGCGVKATVKVTDKDGDYGTLASAAVNVGTGAFLPPMTNQPVTDQLKNGQVLPVKVTIKDCAGNPISGLSPAITLKSGDLTDQNDNSTASITPDSVSSADTTGVMRAQSDGTYMYNMKVNITVGQAYTVVITPNIPGYAQTLTLRHKIKATK